MTGDVSVERTDHIVEEKGDCPVCGEQYFRKQQTANKELKDGHVPLCVQSWHDTTRYYYHA